MEPLLVCLWALGGACVLTGALSLITGELSWVDRVWSVIPVVYVWIFAGAAGLANARLTLIAVLVTLWGIRLTANFARKGGYAPGGEDYRWAVLRRRMSPRALTLFTVFFVVIYQNVLLLLIALPAWTAFLHPAPLSGPDVLLAALFLAFLTGETVADQQQWDFQVWKKAELAAGRAPGPRFLQSGLFRLSRHPNFFFEQAQWWVVFFLGCVAADSLAQWTAIGPLLLTGLFIGSTLLTENITLSRYPEYAEYRRLTSPIVPWFPRRGTGAAPIRPEP